MIPTPKRSEEWGVPSSLTEVRPAADRVLKFFSQLNLSEAALFDIRLCFEESIINGIKYGNREKREIPVKVQIAYNDREIFIAVEDRGEGFNPDKIKDPTCAAGIEAFSGRGVYLIRHLMDRVSYVGKGNRVEMVKVYKKHVSVNAQQGNK